MRIIRFIDESGTVRWGEEKEENRAEILDGNMYEGLAPTGTESRVEKLLAPIEPTNIFCIGLNYRDHAEESQMDIPETPLVFSKGPPRLALG